MNEELQNALTEILNSTIQATGDVKAFVMSELPEVIQQLLMWKAAESFFGMLCWLIALGAIIKWTPRMAHIMEDPPRETGEVQFVGCVLGLVAAVVGSIVLLTDIHVPDWVQIWIAPKVYLIEYAAELAK